MVGRRAFFVIWCFTINYYACDVKVGPDPWDYVSEKDSPGIDITYQTPPDLRIPIKRKSPISGNLGTGDWFFKRTLAIILNGGQTKANEDGSIDISLQMKFESKQWETLNQYVKSDVVLTEEMFRRSIGYVEEAIYKPTFKEKIVVAWNEYIQFYLMEYRMYFILFFGGFAAIGLLIWLWKSMSNKHIIIVLFIGLYIYEVIISYKEAEQKELEKFMSAVNTCSWYFWRSTCDVPAPDPLIFMKHMNPLKISIRMFATLVSEPIIALSATINSMVHSMTDGLWYPFDRIFTALIILFINILLIFMLIMVTFNFLLNIPFNLSFLGLINIGVKQRRRTLNLNNNENNSDKIPNNIENMDRISGVTLNRLLEVCSRALDNSQNKGPQRSTLVITSNSMPKIKRSASTGRLPSLETTEHLNFSQKKQHFAGRIQNDMFMLGAGDAEIDKKKS